MKSILPSIAAVLVLLVCELWALPPADAQALAPTATAASAVRMPNDETLVLRAQLAEVHRFQEQILSTVYWSLGTLAGITVLLVGFGWWTNFRVYERDKQSLEKELRSTLLDALRASKDEHLALVEKRFLDASQQLNLASSNAETRIGTAMKSLIDTSEKQLSAQVLQVKSSHVSLRKEVQELHLAAQLQERLAARAENSFRNALQSSVSALEIANRVGDEYAVGNVLDLISEDVNAILKGKDLPIDNFLIGQLVETLGSVKGSHAHAAAALKAKAPSLLSG